jgi:hypothetical protein
MPEKFFPFCLQPVRYSPIHIIVQPAFIFRQDTI